MLPINKRIDRIPEKTTSLLLLLALVLFLILPILITFFAEYYKIILAVSYSFLILIGSWSVARRRHHLFIGLGLGLISFALIWITISNHSPTLELMKTFSLLAFLSFLSFQLFKSLASREEINISIIFASISGYLLIGMIGGNLFQILELNIPGSFNNLTQGDGLFDLHYFSFVTLSTLGYGDITPASSAAKSLSIVVGLAGQLYLTILIAILVGKFLSSKNQST